MGGSKDDMMRRQDEIAVATAYLVERGDLTECENGHGVTYGGGWKLEDDFWESVMGDRKRGDRGPIPWAAEMPTRYFTDLIKEAYDTNCGDSCAHCDKVFADDE